MYSNIIRFLSFKKHISCLLLSALVIMCANLILSADLKASGNQNELNFPGGIVTFSFEKLSDDIPEVKFGLEEPTIIDQGTHWTIMMGISLNTLPGEYVVYLKQNESLDQESSGLHKKILVRQHDYPYFEAKNADVSKFNSLYLEHKILSSIDFANTRQPSFPLIPPIEGEWSDNFGHKISVVNKNSLITPNSVSLTTTLLGTVISPQNAIVTHIEDIKEQKNLKRIFLDHGRGVYSIISGLTDLTVDVSNGIVAGAVIGKLPSLVESPNNSSSKIKANRLIWQVVMNNEYVNPLLLTNVKIN